MRAPRSRSILGFCFLLASANAATSPAAPIVLENAHLRLSFDGETGAWTGLRDLKSGEELVAGPAPRALVPAARPARLDAGAIEKAVGEGTAVSLAGEWLYTPAPPPESAAAEFLKGRFDAAPWEKTPIPSRRGAGDDRLFNRTGNFWYRREFTCPAEWQGEEPYALT